MRAYKKAISGVFINQSKQVVMALFLAFLPESASDLLADSGYIHALLEQ